jgi:hypothetical protein
MQSIMQTLSVTKTFEFRWRIKDTPYCITKDGKVFNMRTGRQKVKTYNGGVIGYWIGRKFYSLSQMNSLAERVTKEPCPF